MQTLPGQPHIKLCPIISLYTGIDLSGGQPSIPRSPSQRPYCFVSTSANDALPPSGVKMGHLLKIKCVYSRVNMYYLASTRFPLTLKTAQVPNVAQNHTKSLILLPLINHVRVYFFCTPNNHVMPSLFYDKSRTNFFPLLLCPVWCTPISPEQMSISLYTLAT